MATVHGWHGARRGAITETVTRAAMGRQRWRRASGARRDRRQRRTGREGAVWQRRAMATRDGDACGAAEHGARGLCGARGTDGTAARRRRAAGAAAHGDAMTMVARGPRARRRTQQRWRWRTAWQRRRDSDGNDGAGLGTSWCGTAEEGKGHNEQHLSYYLFSQAYFLFKSYPINPNSFHKWTSPIFVWFQT